MTVAVSVLLGLVAGWVALPAFAQLLAWFTARFRPAAPPSHAGAQPRLLFLVPGHNESLLIERCVRSLLTQTYPSDRYDVVVIADNCTDNTADLARAAGATVLERRDPGRRGKHAALDWAFEQVTLDDYAAIVVIDADATVNREFAACVGRWPGLPDRAIQAYDGLTNEFENWLTRLAGLFNRYRYDVELPLKARAGLSVPLTGDGMIIGTTLLRRLGWRIDTITEGWELYARYALAGVRVEFEPGAVFYDQEARSVSQGEVQRQRWAAGRLHVVRLYWWKILRQRGVRLVQRIDLLAELLSLGPVQRGVVALLGIGGTWAAQPAGAPAYYALFATGIAQPLLLSLAVLRHHPEPGPTVLAFARLPIYAAWRVTIGLRSLFRRGAATTWSRTGRHAEIEGR